VAQKDRIIYFIEVKYRSGNAQGGGFEYILPRKLKRMSFAAEVWKQTYNWHGDYRLMASAVSGLGCQDVEIIELD
jgi:Holliday junction resolvase-like predicted endonuclease